MQKEDGKLVNALAIWGLLLFYTNFRTFFSISMKDAIRILTGITLNL